MPYRVLSHHEMLSIRAKAGHPTSDDQPGTVSELVEDVLNICEEDDWRLVGIDPSGPLYVIHKPVDPKLGQTSEIW